MVECRAASSANTRIAKREPVLREWAISTLHKFFSIYLFNLGKFEFFFFPSNNKFIILKIVLFLSVVHNKSCSGVSILFFWGFFLTVVILFSQILN